MIRRSVLKSDSSISPRRFLEFSDEELNVFVRCLMERGLFELMCEVKGEIDLRERRKAKREPKEIKKGN